MAAAAQGGLAGRVALVTGAGSGIFQLSLPSPHSAIDGCFEDPEQWPDLCDACANADDVDVHGRGHAFNR